MMFVITLSDVIGLIICAIAAIIWLVWVVAVWWKQRSCTHKWQFIDPSYGDQYWRCFFCDLKHNGIDDPTSSKDRSTE